MEEGFPEEVVFELGLGEWTCPRGRKAFQAEGKGYAHVRRSLFRGKIFSVIGPQDTGRGAAGEGRQVELINEPPKSTYVVP